MTTLKLGLRLTELCGRYANTSNKSSILLTKTPKIKNFEGLKYAKKFSTDIVQINSKNTIKLIEESKGKLLFYDGEKCIGKAIVSEPCSFSSPKGLLPDSWYIPNAIADETNRLAAYPRLYIDEIIIGDKKGFFSQYQKRTNGKKYGTMCMQKILDYAEKKGYGTRIYLGPAKHGSNIHPGKFYAKIGFEPGPETIKYAEKANERYLKGKLYAEKHPDLPEEILDDLLNRPFYEQIDGRFVSKESFAGEVYLTHPEILKNYPI